MEENLPLLIAWQRPFTPRNAASSTARGVAILQITRETVERFNMPYYPNSIENLTREVKGYVQGRSKSQVAVAGYSRILTPVNSGYIIRLFDRKAQNSRKLSHAIRFPYFFNRWMIGQALGTAIQNNLSEIRCDNGPNIECWTRSSGVQAGSKWGAWLTNSLDFGNDSDRSPWGKITLVSPIVSKARKRLTIIN